MSLSVITALLAVSPSATGMVFLIVPTVTYLLLNLYSHSCSASTSKGSNPETSPVKSFGSNDIFAKALLASLPANNAYGPPGP
uniref:Uncharacterized protein n=1 Tax=Arundo donax TaxID=35708 RepID=A0A0A9CIM5_ARUDO